MKAKIMWGVLVVMMGTGLGMALASGPDSICLPGRPCQIEQKSFDGGPEPICRLGKPCPVGQPAPSSGPDPLCLPGVPCPVSTKNLAMITF
jgi:hypothetical protein